MFMIPVLLLTGRSCNAKATGFYRQNRKRFRHRQGGRKSGFSRDLREKMAKGVFPVSRRFCDGLDRILGRTSGETWVEMQKASREVAQ